MHRICPRGCRHLKGCSIPAESWHVQLHFEKVRIDKSMLMLGWIYDGSPATSSIAMSKSLRGFDLRNRMRSRQNTCGISSRLSRWRPRPKQFQTRISGEGGFKGTGGEAKLRKRARMSGVTGQTTGRTARGTRRGAESPHQEIRLCDGHVRLASQHRIILRNLLLFCSPQATEATPLMFSKVWSVLAGAGALRAGANARLHLANHQPPDGDLTDLA